MRFNDMNFLEDQEEDTEEQSEGVEEDADLNEAERRFTLAAYYKRLVKGGLFDDDSEEASVVDEEIAQFARERMRVLLNLPGKAESKPEMFTEKQVAALRQWADHMIERAARPTEPAIKKMEAPVIEKKPALNKPAVKLKRKKVTEKPMKKVLKESPKATPQVGEEFVENGKRYKFVVSPVANPDGSQKLVKMDVTPQATSSKAIPTPPPGRAQSVYEMHANQSVQAGTQSLVTAMEGK